MSVACPSCCCKLKLELVSTVKMTRPTYNVVEGPGGVSVGKRMRTLCPVLTQMLDPSGL